MKHAPRRPFYFADDLMLVKGWCPGLHKPMEAKDGFLIRLTPPGGVLKSGQLHTLAETAARYGRGIVQVTMRGNLQVRGLQAQSVATCQQILSDAGLSDASPSLERIRQSVLMSPLHAIDPECAPETAEIATNLMAALAQHPLLDDLPPKFCFGIDGGGFLPIGSIVADITASYEGRLWRVRCDQETRILEAAEVVDAIMECAAACATSRPGRRIASPRAANAAPLPHLIGKLPSGWRGYGVVLGMLRSDDIRQIAENVDEIRLLPGRGFMTPRVLSMPCLVTDPDDKMAQIFACCGIEGCEHAHMDTMRDARYFAVTLTANTRLHVSGCRKGCAHPGKADVTLVGAENGYAVIKNGNTQCAETHPIMTREAIGDMLKSQNEADALRK
ncbi:hypothetical protein N5W20_09050 [Candidatus Kirkpatrickella diaphorinae]|uniref:Nitrite/Sulfite reductase ferredoxin-like domain-containing protein n=1 Tax=Candidatus Kirkpatrickella diaphorinae TaxID=2984322 RepID=A0ABY6GIS7_9PROT|nr:hypothetical protein [Candidatus Kirkpatrickella diaphorinae]UYH51219.1 hypothetical protein N5W20_09050 [Candidatus Kirkpatrickella diaphorinae]